MGCWDVIHSLSRVEVVYHCDKYYRLILQLSRYGSILFPLARLEIFCRESGRLLGF